VLRRQEAFLRPADERRPKFGRLTAPEERHGLLDDPGAIGTCQGWAPEIKGAGFGIEGPQVGKGYRSAAPRR
jgi:hypothetical protein